MKPRFVLFSMMVAVLFAGSQIQAQTGPTLRWKLEKGQKFKVVSVNDSKAVMEIGGAKQKMPSKMTTTATWEVLEADNGNFKLKHVVDRIQVEMSTPFADIEFDSDEDEGGDAITASFKALVGKESTVEFNNRGVVKKKEKGDDEESKGGNGLLMSEDMTSQMFFELPEKAVSKGDSWKQKIDNKAPGGSMTMNNTYTYAGKKDSATTSIHQIKVKGDLEMDVEQEGVVMELDEGTVEGTMWFDGNAGYLTKVDMTQVMIMQIEAGGQSITSNVDAKINVTIEVAK